MHIRQNAPLYIKHLGDQTDLRFSYLVHTSLDIINEKCMYFWSDFMSKHDPSRNCSMSLVLSCFVEIRSVLLYLVLVCNRILHVILEIGQ